MLYATITEKKFRKKIEDKKRERMVLYSMMCAVGVGLPVTAPRPRRHVK